MARALDWSFGDQSGPNPNATVAKGAIVPGRDRWRAKNQDRIQHGGVAMANAAMPSCALALSGLLLLAPWQILSGAEAEPNRPARKLDVWYVPTPHEVVERMLDEAKVRPTDVVYDLGCGDGRMVIAAAKRYGARGVGVDLDPARVREARANAKAAGVEEIVTFHVADMFETDIREADVVLLYLLPQLNRRLMPKLFAELKPGARVVSHDFDMGKDWPPDRSIKLGSDGIYVWVMPPLAERPAFGQ